MQQKDNKKNQEIISIEEYLYKRKKIKEQEQNQRTTYKMVTKEQKSSALMLAELYM